MRSWNNTWKCESGKEQGWPPIVNHANKMWQAPPCFEVGRGSLGVRLCTMKPGECGIHMRRRLCNMLGVNFILGYNLDLKKKTDV